VEKSEADCNNRPLERKEELSFAQELGIHAASTAEIPRAFGIQEQVGTSSASEPVKPLVPGTVGINPMAAG
jgi:hypothetical protein